MAIQSETNHIIQYTPFALKRDENLSISAKDFDSAIDPLKDSILEKFIITFTAHGYGKVFISKEDLEELVAKAFQIIENARFRSLLRSVSKLLDRKISLNFPRLAYIHSRDKFDSETHIHVLAILPRQLIQPLRESFELLIKEYNKNWDGDVKVGAGFHQQTYSQSSLNFIQYCARKDGNDEERDFFASLSTRISKFNLGRFNNDKIISDFPYTFEELHLKFLETLPKKEKRTLASVRNELSSRINDFITSPPSQFTLLQSAVGTGKSYLANNLPNQFPDKKILILVKRIENYENYTNYTRLPPLPTDLEAFFKENEESGINAYHLLEKLEPTTDKLRKLKNLYLRYRETEKKILEESQFVVATHSKFFHGSLKNHHFDHIIFDECLLDELTRDTTITFEEMDNFKSAKSIFYKFISQRLDKIETDSPHVIDLSNSVKKKITTIHNKEVEKALISVTSGKQYRNSNMKILSLLKQKCTILKTADGYKFCPHRQSHLDIPNTSFLILSATASEPIYHRLLENLHFCKLDSPELRAKISQDVSINFTKTSLKTPEKRNEALNLLKQYSERGYATIGFKELAPTAHFFAVSSNNNLSGQNLYIQGTPNPERNKFQILISLLGLADVKIENYEGLKYSRNSYQDREMDYFQVSKSKLVNDIYFSLIESELIQAIGRTRPHEYETNIVIHSKFPLWLFAKIW